MDEKMLVKTARVLDMALSVKSKRINFTPKHVEWCKKVAAAMLEASGLIEKVAELEKEYAAADDALVALERARTDSEIFSILQSYFRRGDPDED